MNTDQVDSNQLRQIASKGIVWGAGGRIFQQVMLLVTATAFARVLGPEQIGLVAMVTVVANFANLFADFGLGSSLVQYDSVTQDDYNTVFWTQLALGIAIAVAFVAAAPAIAQFYSEPQLINIARLSSFMFVASSCAGVFGAELTRRMEFKSIAVGDIIPQLLAGAAALIALFLGAGIWSLVLQSVLIPCIRAIFYFAASSVRIGFSWSGAVAKRHFKFGVGLLGYNIISYWSTSADSLLIGRAFGSASLGYYSRAYYFSKFPVSQIVGLVHRVAFPILSSLKNDQQRTSSFYLRALGLVAFAALPACIGLALTASDLMVVTLGPGWEASGPLLAALSIAAIPELFTVIAQPIYTSQGRTGLLFKWGLVTSGARVIGVLVGIWLGAAIWVAVCYAVAMWILLIPSLFIPQRIIKVSLKESLGALTGPFWCAAVMTAVALVVQYALDDSTALIRLLVTGLTGATSYMVVARLLRIGPYRDLVSQLMPRLPATWQRFSTIISGV